MIISVTSSFTPGIELNSCNTPSILIWLIAAPGREESIILLREFPSVVPYPLSSGSTTNLPYFLSSEISAISILGLLKSNTILVPPYGFLYVEGVSFCPVFDKKQDIS